MGVGVRVYARKMPKPKVYSCRKKLFSSICEPSSALFLALFLLFFQKTTFLKAAICMCVWQAHSGFRMTSLCFLKTEIIRDVKSNGWKWKSRTLIKDWDHFGGPIGKSGRDFGMETGVGSLFVLSCWGSCNVTTAVEPVKVDVSNFGEWWPVCSQDSLLVGALWQNKEKWKNTFKNDLKPPFPSVG